MTGKGIILVVDDEPESLKLLTDILAAEAYQVRPADSGELALASIGSEPPELILLDIRMPGMDGFEVCRRLKNQEKSRDIPILFISAAGEAKLRAEGLKLGAVDFISKPFRREELLARVQTHLDLGRLRVRLERQVASQTAELRAANERLQSELGRRDSAENALREQEELARLAMRAGRMYAFEWNPATDVVLRSDFCADILGIPDEPTLDTAQAWFQRIHPDDRASFVQTVNALSPANDTYTTRYRVIRPDGRILHVRESARGLFDAGGRLTRLIGMVADITEAARTEYALQRSEARLRELIRKVPVAVAVKDHGRIAYLNDRFVEIFGYTVDDIPDEAAWWQRAYPDEQYRREVMNFWKDAEEKAAHDGKGFERHECRITCKDGTVRIADAVAATAGEPKLIVLNDITERKRADAALRESEERFRNIADTAPVVIWISGADGRLTFVNSEALKFAGRTLEQDLGTGWTEIVHPDDRARMVTVMSSAIEGQRDFQVEVRLRRTDGEYRWILETAAPRFAGAVYAGHIGIGIDITDLKRQQEQMHEAQKLESLGVLASGIAHDFNNLLGSILSDSELALSELPPGSAAREELQRIGTVAIRAAEIVGQLMVYSGQESEFELIDVSVLVREMLDLLKVSVSKRAVLRTDLQRGLPAVRANPAQIRQVVMNLITNASEALGEKDGTIMITAARERVGPNSLAAGAAKLPAGDYVALVVSDTGSGMTAETQGRIFDPFFTTKFAGRGLGLAAVQGIIRAHGGAVDVESATGQGTAFHILLPCACEPAVKTQSPAPAAAGEIAIPAGSVLFVEDEEMLRVAVAKLLRKRGFAVIDACDGTAAVDLLHAHKDEIAVVLLDLTLPGKSSREVFEEVRRVQPRADVILTSAYGWERVSRSFPELPLEKFVRKPYPPRDLIRVLVDALSASRPVRAGRSEA